MRLSVMLFSFAGGCAVLLGIAGLAGAQLSPDVAGQAVAKGKKEPFLESQFTGEDWRRAVLAARAFVDRETPASALPYAPSRPGDANRVVLADYTPALPISFDNLPSDQDGYARRLPTGQETDAALIGRFGIWQRPLPAGPWPASSAYPTYAAIEIFRAARIGIDGFLLDMLSATDGNRNWETAKLIYAAAAASGTGVRIAVEPDMGAMKDATVASMADALSYVADQPAAYRQPNGHLLVIPYEPEARPIEFWADLRAEMVRRGKPIDIIAQSLNTKLVGAYSPVSIGLSFWGGRDPDSAAAQTKLANALSGATGLPVMMPVAPQDFRPRPRQFWESRNTESYREQWQAAIQAKSPWVHVITWNDYTEGSVVEPSSTTQFLFYDLTGYYAAWYKHGAPPVITRDALFYSFRRQIFSPDPDLSGPGYVKRGATPLANDVELIGFLNSPGQLGIRLGGHTVSASVGAGLQALRMPAVPGTPCFVLTRGARAVVSLAASSSIESQPRFKDALYGGGSNLRPFVATDAIVPGGRGITMSATAQAAPTCG